MEKEHYIRRLREIYEKEKRFPKKSDFSPEEVNRIKSLFGPWPRALEEASLKESKQQERIEKNREKRNRAKLKRQNENEE